MVLLLNRNGGIEQADAGTWRGQVTLEQLSQS